MPFSAQERPAAEQEAAASPKKAARKPQLDNRKRPTQPKVAHGSRSSRSKPISRGLVSAISTKFRAQEIRYAIDKEPFSILRWRKRSGRKEAFSYNDQDFDDAIG